MDNQENTGLKRNAIRGIFWAFSERVLAQFVSFVVSIILARILLPEEYGIIAIVTVIISICNVFVSSGFSTALVQKKEVDETDFSTVFYFGVFFSIVLYGGVYFIAPIVSGFYSYEMLTSVIRVMSLSILISSVKSVQHSYVSRNMQFRKFFFSTLGGTLVSAIIGIVMACYGFGVWALVFQYITNNLIDTIVLWCTVKWRPVLRFSWRKLIELLSFGWKVLFTNLLFIVYNDLRTLIIGKIYTSDDLAFYQKGKQFPSLIVTNINSAISSTLLPVMSKLQDNPQAVRNAMRRFICIGSYILIPMMIGMAVVAEPLVRILLTEKWMECVPYLQLMCISYAFLPLQTANTQAVLAVGRSDISLKTETIKRLINIIILLITFTISVKALVIGEVVSTATSLIVNTVVSKRLFGYGTLAQLKDLCSYIVLSLIMGAGIIWIPLLGCSDILTLLLQVICGMTIYILFSIVFHVESFSYILAMIRPMWMQIFFKVKGK